MTQKIIIGSRGSDLALWQANHITNEIRTKCGCDVSLNIIKTTGDKIDNISFDKMVGKGFFTKELEEALLNKEIDLAVHSLKDLMTEQPDGLTVGAVGYRADRRELLLVRPESFVEGSVLPVKEKGTIGTSSARRKCQIIDLNPSLEITDLRGNVPTRIRKLREKQYDAIIIAKAGVDRLELDLGDLKQIPLDPEVFLPAPAQGILGLQICEDNHDVASHLKKLDSDHARMEVKLERGLLAKFDAGCTLPLGVYSEIKKDSLRLLAVLGQQTGDQWTGLRRVDLTHSDPVILVDQVFEQLMSEK